MDYDLFYFILTNKHASLQFRQETERKKYHQKIPYNRHMHAYSLEPS